MIYSYEFKKKCVDMYREGRWAETPDGVKDPKIFQLMIRRWSGSKMNMYQYNFFIR